MADHIWVEMSYTVILPELASDGTVHIFATRESIEAGKEDSRAGCFVCGVELTKDTIKTQCEGEQS